MEGCYTGKNITDDIDILIKEIHNQNYKNIIRLYIYKLFFLFSKDENQAIDTKIHQYLGVKFFDNFKLNQDIKTQLEEEKENNKKLNENNKQLTQNLEEEKENNKKLNENNKKLTQKLEDYENILKDPNLSMEEKMAKMKSLSFK